MCQAAAGPGAGLGWAVAAESPQCGLGWVVGSQVEGGLGGAILGVILVLLHHVLHLVWPIHPPDESSQAADKISLGFLNSIPKHSPPAMCWLAAG